MPSRHATLSNAVLDMYAYGHVVVIPMLSVLVTLLRLLLQLAATDGGCPTVTDESSSHNASYLGHVQDPHRFLELSYPNCRRET